jgi:ribonuclease D
VIFIEQNSNLKSLYQKILKNKTIFIDTEFERSKTFYPILCLVQISVDKEIFFIDCLSKNIDLQIIKKILENHNITKVFHSCLQDAYVFIDIFHKKITFRNISDIQLIANICDYGKNISYANLINKLLKVELNKESRRSNWLNRPLSEKQVEYAKNDVLYLALAYEKLTKEINQQGKLSQFTNETSNLNKKLNSLKSSYNPYKKFTLKNKSRFYAKKLKKMVDLRDKIAKKLNKPRSFVIEDKLIIFFLKNPPKSIKQISKISYGKRVHPKIKNKILQISNQKENILDKLIKYLRK